jgi:predicted PurR-regulated permease PerM
MDLIDPRTARTLFTVLLFAVAAAIIYLARAVLVVFAFSILLAYLINPVVRFLQRHSLFFKNLKGPHVAEAYLVFLVLAALLVHAFAPNFHRHPSHFLDGIQSFADRTSSGEIADDLGNSFGWTDGQALRTKTFLQQHKEDIQGFLKVVGRFASTVAGGILVIPILAIFFLSGGEKLADQVIRLISTPGNRDAMQSLAAELDTTLQRYIRAKVILAVLSLTYCSVTMLLLGFPNAAMLGMVAGILEFIPVAGWMLAAATILTVGFVTHAHWIWMLLLLLVWRVLMDYGIAPRVMGHELEIHPLLAIFTMMVGGAVGGIVGIYLSIPLVAMVRVIWRRLTISEAPAAADPANG